MTDTTHDWAEQVDRDMRMDHLITRDEAQAMVAAALTGATQAVKQDAENDDISHGAAQWVVDTILALIPQDAQAALDRMLAEAEARGMKDAADTELLFPSHESVEYQRGWDHALLAMHKALTDEAAIRKGDTHD